MWFIVMAVLLGTATGRSILVTLGFVATIIFFFTVFGTGFGIFVGLCFAFFLWMVIDVQIEAARDRAASEAADAEEQAEREAYDPAAEAREEAFQRSEDRRNGRL